MNGTFYAEVNFGSGLCTTTFTQTGSTVTATGCFAGSGTLDTTTGAMPFS